MDEHLTLEVHRGGHWQPFDGEWSLIDDTPTQAGAPAGPLEPPWRVIDHEFIIVTKSEDAPPS